MKIKKRLDINLLSHNFDKIKFITVNTLTAILPKIDEIKIHKHNCCIYQNDICSKHNQKVSCIKYPHLIIDIHLKWDQNICRINNYIGV